MDNEVGEGENTRQYHQKELKKGRLTWAVEYITMILKLIWHLSCCVWC